MQHIGSGCFRNPVTQAVDGQQCYHVMAALRPMTPALTPMLSRNQGQEGVGEPLGQTEDADGGNGYNDTRIHISPKY